MPNQTDKQVAWIILRAVEKMNLGKGKLAAFLKGSKSKLVAPMANEQIYGGLLWHDIPTIAGFIEQLEDMEMIRKKIIEGFKYDYPILELTEAGKKALEDKIEIPLRIKKEAKPITVGESERETLRLFNEGKTIDEVAVIRGLVPSTIYTHLYKLIANDYLIASQVVSMDVIKSVLDSIKKFCKQPLLREMKELLPESISYEEIKCVLADKELVNTDDKREKHTS